MKSRYAIALSSLLICTLTGCPPGKPDAQDTANTGAIPIATTGGTDCTPSRPASVTGQTGAVTEGTYCVCAEHDNTHDEYEGLHLAKGEPIVISTVDLVTEVQLGGNPVSMLLSSDKRQLSQVVNFQHKRMAAAGGGDVNVKHLVVIEPATVDEQAKKAGCSTDAGRNTLKITFCSKGANNGPWNCDPPPGGDFGDTHVQN